MNKNKGSERSEAQLIADKHNGNCFCLEGAVANLNRILYDCIDIVEDDDAADVESSLRTIKERLRYMIERHYEYYKNKAGKSTPQTKLVGNKRN